MYDESWESFREEMLSYAKNKEENLIKKWLNDIGCKNITIGYYRDSSNNIMEIYTTKPGMLIGKAGANVEKLENMLSEEYRGVWKVRFIEVRGDFISID